MSDAAFLSMLIAFRKDLARFARHDEALLRFSPAWDRFGRPGIDPALAKRAYDYQRNCVALRTHFSSAPPHGGSP